MKLVIALACIFAVTACSKKDDKKSEGQAKPLVTEEGSPTLPTEPVILGAPVQVDVDADEPMIAAQYSKARSTFYFTFQIKPSQFGVTEPSIIGKVYLRLVSRETKLPITNWYYQSVLDLEKVKPDVGILFQQPVFAIEQAAVAAANLSQIAIQIAVKAEVAPESGRMYWIDLGGFCATNPDRFSDADTATTGCH